MNTLQKLQSWYGHQCNGNWEHSRGVSIDTLDNPGWRVKIDLKDTDLENLDFQEIKHNYDDQFDWFRCWKSEETWEAATGPEHLETALKIFLDWAKI